MQIAPYFEDGRHEINDVMELGAHTAMIDVLHTTKAGKIGPSVAFCRGLAQSYTSA